MIKMVLVKLAIPHKQISTNKAATTYKGEYVSF